MKVKKNIAFRLRKIREKNLLIGDYRAFELNEVGSLIWDFLSTSPKELSDITQFIAEKYELSNAEIEEDISKYIEYLITINALRRVS